MGLHAASEMWKPKGLRKNMTIILDEGEDIVTALRKAMENHEITECQIIDMEGTLKDVVINTSEGLSSKKRFKDAAIMHASGNYKLSYGEMYGAMYVTLAQKQPTTGKLTAGTSAEGTQIKVSFTEK